MGLIQGVQGLANRQLETPTNVVDRMEIHTHWPYVPILNSEISAKGLRITFLTPRVSCLHLHVSSCSFLEVAALLIYNYCNSE